jgi:hypothetical protein
MANSVSPLNLSAVALSVLQTRAASATQAIKTSLDAEKKAVALLEQASENLAQTLAPSSGSTAQRGQLLNILV